MLYRHTILAAFITCLFVALGSLWIDRPGLEYDETRFVLATWPDEHQPIAYTAQFWGQPIPLMVVSYMGALKGWLYQPVLRVWRGSAAAARFPAVIIGALGLICLYLFIRRALGVWAGLLALALTATDPTYLFTTRLDWGPVAIQHLCVLASCYFVLRWYQERRLRDLALGFFTMGVGLFDKSTFVWLMAGLGISAALVFPRELWRSLRPKPIATAALAFLIGSSPFLYYCYSRPAETFRPALEQSEKYGEKLQVLLGMLRGSALVGGITREPAGEPLAPPDPMARMLYQVAPRAAAVQTLLLAAIILLAVLFPAVPFRPWGRGMLFSAVFCVLVFLQMLPLRDAGTSPHHTVLMFPFPQIFVSAGLAGLKDRLRRVPPAVLVTVAVVLVVANLRSVAQHYFHILAYGGSTYWSEAIYPLADALRTRQEKIVLLDWGMTTQLRLLGGQRLRLVDSFPDAPVLEAGAVYVRHAPGGPALYPQAAEGLLRQAEQQGYKKEVRAISDTRGRPIYEILLFRK